MQFLLIDDVLEQSADRILAIKQVSLAEEYLADHFPRFPVLPGVLMLEAMVQAARLMLDDRGGGPLVLGEVKAFRYGTMVRPGEALVVEVTLDEAMSDGTFRCRGTGKVRRPTNGAAPGETAVTGRFTMRPLAPVKSAR